MSYDLKIGDQIIGDNGVIYTLGEGNGYYTFSIIDEKGKIVNYVHDSFLEDCLQADEDFYTDLIVGINECGDPIRTRVVKHIAV